jgi:hypothetical protein
VNSGTKNKKIGGIEMSDSLKQLDHAPLGTNQATIIVLLLVAFVLNLPWLVTLVALAMILGTVFKRPGFGFLYTALLKKWGWVKLDVFPDNPEPHRFAQGFGGVVAAGSAVALWLGASTLGWILTWVVILLASVNLFLGFCAGCAVYYWLNALKVPGFKKSAPSGVFPGLRPKKKLA